MIRKLYTVVALTVMAVLIAPAVASAENPPYPAPPVTPAVVSSVIAVSPTAQQGVPTSPLASTGAGLDIGVWLGIGAVVLLVGIALTVVGGRLVASKNARPSSGAPRRS